MKWDIWRLLGMIAIEIVAFGFGPYALLRFHYIQSLEKNAFLILFFTALGLVIKTLMNVISGGDLFFYKFGFDLCTLSLGATLTSFSLQLSSTSDHDLLANAQIDGTVFSFVHHLPVQTAWQQHNIILATLFVGSLVCSLLTALITKAIKKDNPFMPNALAGLNTVIGLILFAVQIWLVVVKKS